MRIKFHFELGEKEKFETYLKDMGISFQHYMNLALVKYYINKGEEGSSIVQEWKKWFLEQPNWEEDIEKIKLDYIREITP